MRRTSAIICFVCAASLLPIGVVHSLQNADTVAAIAHHRQKRKHHRRKSKGNDFSNRSIDAKNNVGRTHSSLHSVNRGGGREANNPTAPAPASKKVLQSMRLLYLTYYASLGALLPYLPVFFHSLGHPGSAIGLLGAVKPFTTFLVAPLWGILSDRSNNHVSTLQFTFVSSLIFQLLVGMNSTLNGLIISVFMAAALNAPVKSLIDNIVMSKLTSEEDKYQFGRMRLWGQLGFGVGSSLVGSLLSAFPSDSATGNTAPTASFSTPVPTLEKAETAAVSTCKACTALVEMTRNLLGRTRPLKGYEWAFFAHAVLSIPVFFCIRAFQPRKEDLVLEEGTKKKNGGEVEEKKKTDIGEGLRLLTKNKDALIFFFLVFVIGTSSGCIENFAYVRVREVGGTGNNMGILRLVSSLAGAPMFWFSGPVTEALGTDVVLVLSLLGYVARFFNYALMSHPYHALPAEALRGITFALFWSSGSMYAHKISPTGMKATMLLIMNAMYGGLGQSMGAIIGGKMQSKLGTIKTFVYSGIFDACFVGALVAYLVSVKGRAFGTPSIDQ